MRGHRLVLVVALATAVAACGSGTVPEEAATPDRSPGPSAGDALASDGRFEIMIELLGGFVDRMRDPSWNGTLFAPTDETFRSLPADTLARLRDDANLAERTQVIRAHILPFRLPAERFESRALGTAHGEHELQMVVRGDVVSVDGATVVEADLIGTNGVVHVIDGVLGLDAGEG